MKSSIILKMLVVLTILAVMMGMVQANPAMAAKDEGQSGSNPGATVATTSIKFSAAEQKAALAHFTRDALQAQSAIPMPIDNSGETPQINTASDAAALGTPGFVEAGRADPVVRKATQKLYASDWKDTFKGNAAAISPADAETMGTAGVYTSYYGNIDSNLDLYYPNEWIGRLSNNSGYCSATALSGNTFVTAAHCIYDTVHNSWYYNIVFTPAYRYGSAPVGSFAATNCTVLTAWINLSGTYTISTWTHYDIAVCSVGTNSGGYTLNQEVGWNGYYYNQSYDQSLFNMGYPFQTTSLSGVSYPGEFMRICAAESFQYATDVIGMGCNFGPGMSGGPMTRKYFLDYNNGSGYVDSVNSGMITYKANLYGIRFTSSNIVPLCTVRGCY